MSTLPRFHDLIADAAELTILCIGDIMLDRFVYGRVDRISPEAPIPVLRVEREDTMLGGAGNVIRNLASLGSQAHYFGRVGTDVTARTVHHLLEDQTGAKAHLYNDDRCPTIQKTRYMAGTQQMLRADFEETPPLTPHHQATLLKDVSAQLANCQAMILSDYGKGVLENDCAHQLITMAQAAGVPVVVDPKGTDYSLYRGASVITPNRKELSEASGMICQNDDQIIRAARHIIDTCGIEAVLATRSQDGMSLIHKDGSVLHLPTRAREVFDVSGAGDTVVATLALCLASGASLAEGAELANIAAGLVVAKIGTATVYGEELIDALHHRDLSDAEDKIMGKEAATDRVRRWKQQGKTVGFTNGCFDLLHPGHISLLKQSASQCDKLIVGLNSDASVKRLKGEERPLQNEIARATVLSSLEMVDMVVIFQEDTPLETLEALVPDVLVKGADYTIDQVVGAELIQKAGGRVFLADLKAGFSTTNTVNKMKKAPSEP